MMQFDYDERRLCSCNEVGFVIELHVLSLAWTTWRHASHTSDICHGFFTLDK